MGKKRIHLEKGDVLTFLAGHRHANQIIQEEKGERLLHMKPEESLSEYIALCEVWDKGAPRGRLDALEKRRIAFLIERRKKLNKVGRLEKTGKSTA
ncbi:MAG: hypothetical protein AB1487_00030 [Thermodesulfobacteriota bacterium]